MYILNTTQTAV